MPLARLAAVLLGILVLEGCGALVLRGDPRQKPAANEAHIVLGMGFGNTNLDAYSAVVMQKDTGFNWSDAGRGVVRERFADEAQRSQAHLTLNGSANYGVAPDGGVAYRSFPVTVGQKALVYVAYLGSAGKDGIFWSCRYLNPDTFLARQYEMPVTFWLPGERYMGGSSPGNWKSEQALWSFTACYVTIAKPGVYYLGDLLLHGQAASEPIEPGSRQMTLRGARLETARSPEGVKRYLAETGLDALPQIEPDGAFMEHAGRDWWCMVQGLK